MFQFINCYDLRLNILCQLILLFPFFSSSTLNLEDLGNHTQIALQNLLGMAAEQGCKKAQLMMLATLHLGFVRHLVGIAEIQEINQVTILEILGPSSTAEGNTGVSTPVDTFDDDARRVAYKPDTKLVIPLRHRFPSEAESLHEKLEFFKSSCAEFIQSRRLF